MARDDVLFVAYQDEDGHGRVEVMADGGRVLVFDLSHEDALDLANRLNKATAEARAISSMNDVR